MNKLMQYLLLIALLSDFSTSYAHITGPYLIWGGKNLNSLKHPTLKAIDINALHKVFAEAGNVIVFTKNSTSELSRENYPQLLKLIEEEEEFIYTAQSSIQLESHEHLYKREVHTPHGTPQQQDKEIVEHFLRIQKNLGYRKVIGIVAVDDTRHAIVKRDHHEHEEKTYIYLVEGKAMLYTTNAPILNDLTNKVKHELTIEENVTTESEDDMEILNVQFMLADKLINLKFIFKILKSGYWKWDAVQYEDQSTKSMLNITGRAAPEAPLRFSYGCHGTFVFKNDNMTLTLKNLQVQPRIDGHRFGRVWDCVAFTSIGVLSGIFVTAICSIAVIAALTALMNMKTK